MESATDTLTELHLDDVPKLKSGKVREVFDLGDALLMVATDRLSAFDCILPTGIPDKGRVLNQLSAWWFNRTGDILPNHMLSIDTASFPAILSGHRDRLRGRSMLVKKARALPVECVVRGYLAGSGWKEYQQTGSVCGLPLRQGYRLAERLDQPVFTPAAKAETGHDENISFDVMAATVGAPLARKMRDASMALYDAASTFARQQGIIIADTKFEFGLVGDDLTLIDEALTPDSSRFWPVEGYEPGRSPRSFDKQFVRDYLEDLPWDKNPPAPELPPDIVARTREKYRQVFRILTGNDVT